MKRFAAVAAAVLAGGCGSGQEEALEPLVRAVVQGGAPGALVYVSEGGGEPRTAAAGRARLDVRRALAPGDRFRVASLTKVFTATLTLQLVADGVLRLDDPVEMHLPGLLERGRTITVRDLLSHRSGLYDHTDLPEVYNVDREWTPRQLVALSQEQPRQAGFAYSSTNYVVLGLLIERLTGRSYAANLRDRITEPLGLARTTYEPDAQPDGAHGHVVNVHDGFVRPARASEDTSAYSATWAGSAGAVVSTAADLATFLDSLVGSESLLPRRLRAQMIPPARPSRTYGLGLVAHPLPCGHGVGHTGNLLGTVTVAYRVGERTVVAMTNQHPLTQPSDEAFRRLVERAACG